MEGAEADEDGVADGLGDGEGTVDGLGDAVGVVDGLAVGDTDGLADGVGVATGVLEGRLDGAPPAAWIGATGAPLLALQPPNSPANTTAKTGYRKGDCS